MNSKVIQSNLYTPWPKSLWLLCGDLIVGQVGGMQTSYNIAHAQLRNHGGHKSSEESQFLIYYKIKAIGFADGLDVRMIGGKRKARTIS